MRLLNVYTSQLREFERSNRPSYAIGSHRWTEDEAAYIDVLEDTNTESEGHKKIKGFCDLVKSRNERLSKESFATRLDWIWLDTCCIDRRSSAEIGENITSMYRYYEQAVECYAYLSDVTSTIDSVAWVELHNSVWFTRGWTLQELLAPSRVFFISAHWKVIGHKCPAKCNIPWRTRPICCTWGKSALNHTISDITGICTLVLNKRRDPRKVSPEEICKWAEKRETKMDEDLAYCLLGLVGVFIIPNYGEGDNAWSRLEEKVSKKRAQECSLPRPTQLLSVAGLEEPLAFRESPTHALQRLPSGSTRPRTFLLLDPLDDGLWKDREQHLEAVRMCRAMKIEQDQQEQRQYERREYVKWEEEEAERSRVGQKHLNMALRSHNRKLEEERETRRRNLEEYMEPMIARRQYTEVGAFSSLKQQQEREMPQTRRFCPDDQATSTKMALLRNMVGQALSRFTLGLPQVIPRFGDSLSWMLRDDDYTDELFELQAVS